MLLNIIIYSVIIVLFYLIFIRQKIESKNTTLAISDQTELTGLGPFLSNSGQVIESGWSRKYVRKINIEKSAPVWLGLNCLKSLRLKKIENYSFFVDQKLIQIGIGNIGYAGFAMVNIFDFKEKRNICYQEKMLPGLDNFPKLQNDPFENVPSEYIFKKKDFSIVVKKEAKENGDICLTKIDVKIRNDFIAEFQSIRNIKEDDHFEIMTMDDDNKYWYYNLKSYNNECEASLNMGNNGKKIDKQKCIGLTDLGRGMFRYKTNWIWVTGYGKDTLGDNIGLNFGGGIGKNSRSVEDYFKVNGKIHKVNPVVILSDSNDLMKPVVIRTHFKFNQRKSCAEIIFTPIGINKVQENLILVHSGFQYVYGGFSGKVFDESGVERKFANIYGMMETGVFKW